MNLDYSITQIAGVGEKLAEKLARLNVTTPGELLHLYPKSYEDYGHIVSTKDVQPGKITIKVEVVSIVGRYVRRRMHVTEAVVRDRGGELRVVWFNQPYRERQLPVGADVYMSGNYDLQRNRYVLLNPTVEKADGIDMTGSRIQAVYRETKGLNSAQLRKIVQKVLPLAEFIPETLPEELLATYKFLPLSQALRAIHAPVTTAELEQAKRRLEFEELLAVLLAAVLNRRENASLHSWQIPFDTPAARNFVTQLPFTLTNAQRRAAWDIVMNFESAEPMNRLLQGDVGSGKTVVAGMAAFLAARQGYQTAFMAPTEILAQQHAETLAKLLAPFHVTVGLLTGSVKGKPRAALLESIENGSLAVTVGTHALIQPTVRFHKLGFVVIDEQHRFGVDQRRTLLDKSERMPHLLSMSATPIPRSLALTVYGELDISILDELPAGRRPIISKIISPNSRETAYAAADAEIAEGRQAYIVCPQIEAKDDGDTKSVELAFKRLASGHFKHRQVAMLHGKMKPEQKEAIMQAFKRGEVDVLVSTTVIEVGVDVPNATVMIIESADTFGLAQLHQLRGRVGRSSHQSYCYLIPADSKAPSRRLRELENSQDGFYLAEIDLELRGPGEVYGRSQSGQLDLRLARLNDTKMVALVREAAGWLLARDIDITAYPELHARVERMRRVITLN